MPVMRRGMTSLAIDDSHLRAAKAEVSNGKIYVQLNDGREMYVPLAYFPELLSIGEGRLKKLEIVERGRGIFFNDVDEAISIASIFGAREESSWL